jgi:hypothetical protein
VTVVTLAELVANIPKAAGDCVGLLDYKGRLFVACQWMMFEFFPSPTHNAKGRLLPIELDNLADPPGIIIMRNALQFILKFDTGEQEAGKLLKAFAREALEEAGYPLEAS